MDYLNLNPDKGTIKPQVGKLLIAEPLLNDPNFSRAVVLICEHGDEGSLGFVLNHTTEIKLQDILPELDESRLDIYEGGPVKADTLHILHRMPQIEGGVEIANGIYWGGSYDSLKETLWSRNYESPDIRLFMGYSGWAPGQLEEEMREGAWLVGDVSGELLFDTDPEQIWKKAMTSLGKKYSFLANMPTDPQLN